MHTRNINVKTAAYDASGGWGKAIRQAPEKAHYNVASAEEAYAHYCDPFTRFDICIYFLRGFAESLLKISEARLLKLTSKTR